jgi:SAM-dependent methyltransferase
MTAIADLKQAHRGQDVLDVAAGDAEALPYAGASFDLVRSIFGVQFAPRHDVAAAELARVCRPGGRIGLVNWTPGGFIGQFLHVVSKYMPAPPAYASAPPLWGDENHVRARFLGTGIEWEFGRGHNRWRLDSPEDFAVFLETNYGPAVKARVRLEAEGRWLECRSEIVTLIERWDEHGVVRAEYLVAVGRKAA